MSLKASAALSDRGIRAVGVPEASGAVNSSRFDLSAEYVLDLPATGVRSAKISRLKKRIAAGQYRISDIDLADKLIDTMLEPS